MDLKELIKNRRRELNLALSLVGVIPFLVFVYILIGKIADSRIFVGEIGYIMLATMLVFLTGIVVGRKMFMSLMNEIIEKNRLAAVTETVLALGHEINNPLLTMSGNLELMESDFAQNNITGVRSRLNTVRGNCDRIREVTVKLASISRPVSTDIFGNSRMVDLGSSQ